MSENCVLHTSRLTIERRPNNTEPTNFKSALALIQTTSSCVSTQSRGSAPPTEDPDLPKLLTNRPRRRLRTRPTKPEANDEPLDLSLKPNVSLNPRRSLRSLSLNPAQCQSKVSPLDTYLTTQTVRKHDGNPLFFSVSSLSGLPSEKILTGMAVIGHQPSCVDSVSTTELMLKHSSAVEPRRRSSSLETTSEGRSRLEAVPMHGSLSDADSVHSSQSERTLEGYTNVRMRRFPEMTPTETKDAMYWEKRWKNNAAARRSRQSRRAKESELSEYARHLETANARLQEEVTALRQELAEYRTANVS